MKLHNLKQLCFLGLLALVYVVNVNAQNDSTMATDDNWDFAAGIYGWLPTINGEISYPLGVEGLPGEIRVDPGDILKNLSFTAQLTFAAKKGDWGFFADGIYLSLKDSETLNIPVSETEILPLSANLKLQALILNAGGTYKIFGEHGSTYLEGLLGLRYFYNYSKLSLVEQTSLTAASESSNANLVNAIIGATGRVQLAERWFVPYYLDIGTGATKFTWQGMTGINYDFKWGGIVALYRYLKFDQGDDIGISELSMNGPELGVFFRF